MEAKAVARYIHQSPRKIRKTLDSMRGLKVGDAVVSSKHANFLINTDNATAGQIEDLGKIIIEKVYNKFQIILDWEIKIVGDVR